MTFLKKAWFLHPVLFTLTPILFLYAHNVDQVRLEDTVLPLGAAVAALGVVLGVLLLALRDRYRSGVLCSAAFMLFFSYGHVQGLLWGLRWGGFRPGRTLVVLPVFALVMVLIAVRVIRSRRDQQAVTRTLNLVGLFFTLSTLVTLGWNGLRAEQPGERPNPKTIAAAGDIHRTERPDIYYIVLDGYARADVLRDVYSYDNSAFLDYLRSRDFVIADESKSNYTITFLSLASSLNMSYLDDLYSEEPDAQRSRAIPSQMIENNALQAFLKEAGYRIIHFSSGWGPTDFNPNADVNLSSGIWNKFLMVVVKTSMLRVLQRYITGSARYKVSNAFHELASPIGGEAPKFVFAHIICPHPPYLFDEDGSAVNDAELSMYGRVWENKKAYLNQLRYVNTCMERIIDSLLAADHEPVIVVQADHGTASLLSEGKGTWANPGAEAARERLAILNAYYLPHPDRDGTSIPRAITPVNSFRLVLASVFGVPIGLLDDRCYFSNYETPYNFRDMTSVMAKRDVTTF